MFSKLAIAVAVGAVSVAAAGPSPAVNGAATTTVPLVDKTFAWNNIPQKVDNDDGPRGIQVGFNKCDKSTENQQSMCQTSHVNSIDDFCLWSAPKPGSIIADTEGETVAWCTKPGYGTRLIPPGALTGVQLIKTPDYIQITGHIDQTKVDLTKDDSGGELDPHGADFRGNPLGGLMYSTGFGNDNTTFLQVHEWNNYMGGNIFCIKVCNPSSKNAASLCQHIYDRIGCAYVSPASYQDGVFESCQGENQDPPGVYVTNGQTMTYTQPPESLGPITTIPYTARIPATSNCVQFQSSQLYAALATVLPDGASSSAAASSASATASSSSASSGSGAGSASASATGTNKPNGAGAIASPSSAGFWMGITTVIGGLLIGVAAI